jgi:hypothetical protein
VQLIDLLQLISLIAVVVTLLATLAQTRQVARQTRELSHQTRSLQGSLEQSIYQSVNSAHDEYRTALMKDDRHMLRWYLSTRGYAVSSHQENKRTLYVIIKLETHEGIYLSHIDGTLRQSVWEAWLEVLRVDLEMPHFRSTWPAAKRFYAKPFAEFVDELMLNSPASRT